MRPRNRISMSTRSGWMATALSIASSPDAAIAGTSYPRTWRFRSMSLATMLSSSTTRICAGAMGAAPFIRLTRELYPEPSAFARLGLERASQLIGEGRHQLQARRGSRVEVACRRESDAGVAHDELARVIGAGGGGDAGFYFPPRRGSGVVGVWDQDDYY